MFSCLLFFLFRFFFSSLRLKMDRRIPWHSELVHHLVMHLLLSDIFLHSCCIQSYCRHIQSFRYPMNELTLSFKGISRRRCTWSGIRCPSTISTSLYLQGSFMISFRSFRLYFGVNTCGMCNTILYAIANWLYEPLDITFPFYLAVTWTLTIIEGTVMFLSNCLALHMHSRWFTVSHTTYDQLSKDYIKASLVLQ